MIKKIRTIVIFLLGFAVISSCSSNKDKNINIIVAVKTSAFFKNKQTFLEDNFKKRFNAKLSFILIDSTHYEQKLMQLLISKKGLPHIIECEHPMWFYYLKAIEPVEKFITLQELAGNSNELKTFFSLRTDAKGTIHSLSLYHPEPLVLIGRKDWLEALNISFPGSIEELIGAVRQITQLTPKYNYQKQKYGFSWEGDFPHFYLNAYNGKVIDYDLNQHKYILGIVGSPGNNELQTFSTLYQENLIPPEIIHKKPGAMNNLFIENRLLFLLVSLRQAWKIVDLLGSEKVEIGGLPRGGVKPYNGRVPAWGIVAGRASKPGVNKFFKWWYSPETFRYLTADMATHSGAPQSSLIPSVLSLYYSSLAGQDQQSPLEKKCAKIIKRELFAFHEHPYQTDIERIIEENYFYALTGTLSVLDALRTAEKSIEKKMILNLRQF